MEERELSSDKVRELLAQLAEAREGFRAEVERQRRQDAKKHRRRAAIRRLHVAARAEKLRLRTLYKRFLLGMKRKWSKERRTVAAERAALTADRADIERFADQSRDYQTRLHESWEQLHEAQRRLLEERRQGELWMAQQADAFENRFATMLERERQTDTARTEREAAVAALNDEIAGLEARAANARAAVEQFELRQSRMLLPADGFGEPVSTSLVSLDSQSLAVPATADGLLDDLQTRQRDLDRARRKIFAARDELERQTASLGDQRAILSEQVAALVAARELWNSAEVATLAEMEDVAKALRGRERAIEHREQQLIEAEGLSRDREADLWKTREQIEAWRRTLAGHEAALSAVRDQHAAALDHERSQLQWREESLGEIVQAWHAIREKERARFVELAEKLEADRDHWRGLAAEAEADRRRFAEELGRFASTRLAGEESGGDPRRLRVMKAAYERHFQRWERKLDERRNAAERSEKAAVKLIEDLQSTALGWFTEQSAICDHRTARDRGALEAGISRDTTSAVAETENEFERLRSEIDRLEAPATVAALSG